MPIKPPSFNFPKPKKPKRRTLEDLMPEEAEEERELPKLDVLPPLEEEEGKG